MTETTTDLVPPRPAVNARFPGPMRILTATVDDLLGLFPEVSFRHHLMPLKTLTRRVLVVNEPELVRQVYITSAGNYEAKSQHFQQALVPLIGDSMFVNDGEVWSSRRAVMARHLHPSRMTGYHNLFVEGAEALAAGWNGRFDIAPGIGATTALVVMRALFGDTARMADAQRLVTSFTAFEGAVMAVDMAHVFGLPRRFSGFQFHTAWRHARDVRRICTEAMAIAEPGGILGALRDARKNDGAALLDEAQLISEVAFLLLAGSETSANALCWALYLVARHPPTLARLREELARVLGGRAPTAEELNLLPFTRAVLQETLRLYPPVPYLSRQAAAPDRIRHIAVRPGDTVLALPWLLHRHERLWDAPHAFRPDRFFGDAARKVPRFGYIPFSLGPRVCTGAAFAMAEMLVMMAVLLQRLDISAEGCPAPVPRAKLSLRPRNGVVLNLAPRAAGGVPLSGAAC